jgi:hypothetical protein
MPQSCCLPVCKKRSTSFSGFDEHLFLMTGELNEVVQVEDDMLEDEDADDYVDED